MSTTPNDFETAMNTTLEAAQVAEQEARLADMGRMAAITARCECILEQNPQPSAVGCGLQARGCDDREDLRLKFKFKGICKFFSL